MRRRTDRAIHAFVLVIGALASAALADLPPGYQVVPVTQNSYFERMSAINNRGQIVFSRRLVLSDNRTMEIFLYDHGVLTQLTNDFVYDDHASINDDGVIVWSRYSGPGETAEIAAWCDGALSLLTSNAVDDMGPSINRWGHIAWQRRYLTGCASSESDICFFDGSQISVVFSDGRSNQAPRLNDLDDIVWSRYNFCDSPWTSEVWMHSNGVSSRLTTDQFEAQTADINNQRQVVWFYRTLPSYDDHLQIWEKGITTTVTDWGSGARINDRGEILFNRWYADSQVWQLWLIREGRFFQLTNAPYWNYWGDINNRGEVVWSAGTPFDVDIRWLRRLDAGDLNCDGAVNVLDIDAFVLALLDAAAYAATYPHCDALLADFSGDGQANVLDINDFVAALGVVR
ncbi:hypothetical protein RAS1_03990 [Phycisphaerae bacterium RAS1]|nr:hypothetical protein RAS1_03990 [Phycisphaerae bacterium RAS1]